MISLLAQCGAVAIICTLFFFAGRARGVEEAGRRWIAVVNRNDLGWRLAYRAMNETHVELEQALIKGLSAAREAVTELRARLDATAIPKERN